MASPHTAGAVALLWAIRPAYAGNISATTALLAGNAVMRTTSQSCGGIAARRESEQYLWLWPAGCNEGGGCGRHTGQPAAGGYHQYASQRRPAGELRNAGSVYRIRIERPGRTSTIQWSGPGTPATASGGSITKTFSCATELGNQTVTAR